MPTDYPYTHLRSVWENPAQPVKGPGAFPWATADRVAVHYTAADDLIDGDPGEHAGNLPAYLRAIQNDYTVSRGYSIGYGIAVDWLGGTWQLRGTTWKNAANLNWNHRTLAILCLVDSADPLTDEAVVAVRSIVAWFRAQSPFGAVPIVGHRDIGATACPGAGIYEQLRDGLFEPVALPQPPEQLPPPPVPASEVDMLILNRKRGTPDWDAMTWTGTHLAGIRGGVDLLKAAGVPEFDVPDDDAMDRIIHSGQTTNDCPPSMAKDQRLRDSWAARRAG